LDERDCNLLRASYIPSKKNIQVSKFYDRLGMEVESFTEKETKYIMKPPFSATKPAWIELKN
jgi:predicted enzyme involved in methoxymalonyl-ACP biosynthesis